MTAKDCHDQYQKCSAKVCGKSDQNCQFQAQLAQIMKEPYEEKTEPYDYEKEKDKDPACKGYNFHQNASCECVNEAEFEPTVEKRLKTFYKLHNPDKLGENGEIKDVATVWSKWRGKEAQMFLALTQKYKDK